MFLSWICHRIQQDSTHCDRSVLHFPGAGNAQTDLDCSDMFGLLLCWSSMLHVVIGTQSTAGAATTHFEMIRDANSSFSYNLVSDLEAFLCLMTHDSSCAWIEEHISNMDK